MSSSERNLVKVLVHYINTGDEVDLVLKLFQALQNPRQQEVGTINLGIELNEQALPFAKQCWWNLGITDESTALGNINVVHTVQDRTFIRENISVITNARLSSLFSENEIAELFLFWLQCASCFHCETPRMIAGVFRELWTGAVDDRNYLSLIHI